MRRTLTGRVVLLALLVGGLVAADRALDASRAARREEGLRIAPFLPEARANLGALAAVRIETGTGESWLYGQKQGQWRCLTWRGALADGDALLALVSGLVDAVGVPLSEDPARPQDYGLDLPSSFTVSLHGPKAVPLDPARDRLVAVDLGAPLLGGTGCFARRHAERTVWSIDTAPGLVLPREEGDRVPPLVERKLVAGSWADGARGIERALVEHAGEAPYELVLREVEVSRDQFIAGRPPFEWLLLEDGAPQDCAELLILYYVDHVLNATWTGLADPALAAHVGLDRPRAKVTLGSGSAPPLELVLGAKLPGGVSAVWNSLTQQLCEVSPEEEALLFPALSVFAPDTHDNPWER